MTRLNRANGMVSPYRYRRMAVALCAAMLVHACAGTRGSTDAGTPYGTSGMVVTDDGFPNINVVPQGDGAQFTPDEKAQLMADLAAARARQAGGDTSAATAAEIARLRNLARIHAAEALREIEGS